MAVIKRVRLSEIAELVTKGTTPTTLGYEFQDTGVNFLKIECFSEKGDYIQNKATHISEECHEKLKRSQLKEGDILFSIAGVIGRVAIVTRNMLPANINQALAIIRIKKDDIYLPYVKLILTSPLIKKQFERKKQGVAQLNISLKDINDLEIPLPEISKQIEYANSFKKVEKLIYTRQYQLQKLDELVKARFVEMFGNPVCNTFNWPKIELGKRCEITTGNTPSRAESENYGTFIEWIKSDNINTPSTFLTVAQEYLSEIGFQKCRFVESGSLLMTCIAGSLNCIGNVAITDRRVAFNQQINAITPKYDNVLYLYWLIILSKPIIHRTINMALKGILSKSQLSSIEFPFPPLSLQNQFASFVTQVDKSKVAVQKSLDEAQLLFDSLMQQYFG